MWRSWRSLALVAGVFVFAAAVPVQGAAAERAPARVAGPAVPAEGGPAKDGASTYVPQHPPVLQKPAPCAAALSGAAVAGPTDTFAWKVGLEARTAVFDHLPGKSLHPSSWVGPDNAPWLMVLGRPRADQARCWVRVRLPWRPNDAAGWINAGLVVVKQTQWRIDVSTEQHTLTLLKSGKPVRSLSIVDGKPSTPTPTGMFAVAWAIPWHPNDFLGSWVLELTAHSDILRTFEGGDGTVGIHGRGGASLIDPLGSSLSHGCIRLDNASIDWLVGTVNKNWLSGTPVQVS